jgi:hypothetical protein
MNQFEGNDIYVKSIQMDNSIVELFNKEMAEYGLPGAWNFLAFKRKNCLDKNPRVHIDASSTGEIHSSIVIPIEGCKDTHMYWMTGEYTVYTETVNGSPYLKLNWKTEPIVHDQVEIYDEPMLTRVDIPHNATSRLDGSYRTALTIRLLGNPSFDEIIKTRFLGSVQQTKS